MSEGLPGAAGDVPDAAVLSLEAAHGSSLFAPSLVFERGDGVLLFDAGGREYLDCAAGIGVASVGHSNPRLAEAIARQAERLLVCPPSHGNRVRAELLRRLCELARAPLTRVFLSNSGSEANEAAIKWAGVATSRPKLVAAKRGFAGRTLGSLAITANAAYRRPFEPLNPDVEFVPFDDEAALAAAVDDRTAAVVLEPVQGEGGVHPASAGYLRAARELTRARGALLVLDEVQCGVGRTGTFLAAHGYGVDADIVTLAKGLAGGVPIGATLMTDAVARAMPRGGHGSTFGGNPLACAAALAVIEEIEARGLLDNAQRMGERLRVGLAGIPSPRVRAVRGRGLMVGLELKERAAPLIEALRNEGLLTVSAGANVIRFLPPLTITAAQVDKVVEVVASVLESSAGSLGRSAGQPPATATGPAATLEPVHAALDDHAAVDLLTRAVACPSPSGREAAVARLLVDAMAKGGAIAAVDAAGNAVGTWGDGPLHVMFLGHIDTVPGHVPVRVTDGRLYGRGSVDAKGAICTAIAAASRLESDALSRMTLQVVGAVEEEAPSSRGARHIVATSPPPDLVIVGEPSGWQGYTLGYKGRLSLRLEARRDCAHGARDDASATEMVLDAYSRLRRWVEEDGAGITSAFERLQVTLRRISSSDDGLTETCVADVVLRLPPRWSAGGLVDSLTGLSLGGGVALSVLSGEEPYRADNRTPLARAFRVAIRASGGTPRPTLKTGTSDMNVVAAHWRVPMLAYGPGDAALDHTPDEHIEMQEYLSAIGVMATALSELSREPSDLVGSGKRRTAGR